MSTNENRTEARDWAEASDDSRTLAVTHGLLYVGDMVAELTQAVRDQGTITVTPPPSPKLQALLSKPTPLTTSAPSVQAESDGEPGPVVMPNGRPYKPAHDPRHWKMDPTSGQWISPAGRSFSPTSRQVLGVIARLESMRRAGTLYTKPLGALPVNTD